MQVRDFIRRNEQKQLKKFKDDDWNELDLIVKNDVFSSAVNGKVLSPRDELALTVKEGKADAETQRPARRS